MIRTPEEFLKLAAPRRAVIRVRGEEIHVREPTVAERTKVRDASAKDLARGQALLLAFCVETPEGKPMFTEEQAAKLSESASEVFDLVASGIFKLSIPEDDEKNA